MRNKQRILYYEELIKKAFSIKKTYIRVDYAIEIKKITGLDMMDWTKLFIFTKGRNKNLK